MAKRPGQNTGPRREKPKPALAAAPSHAPISPARVAAFEILERVAATDAHSDDLLHSSRLTPLSQADRNLCTALVLGVLRWQIALDSTLRPLFSRPDQVVASPILTALRLGVFQLRYMDRIPAHAALSESVELVRFAGQPQAAAMVNAVLRRVSRSAPARIPLVESTTALAERFAHPVWLVSRWEKFYGRVATAAVCAYDQEPPRPDAPSLFIEEEGLPMMDEGSRLIAELAAAAVDQPVRIWDCCAAPGGKTLMLERRHPTASLLATDVSPSRLRALTERLRAAAPRVVTALADVATMADDGMRFDLILCDVPCSGTGTLARNPEIKTRLSPPELGRQAARQRAILEAALARLAPGGRLLYSTCSLEPEENEQVITAVLEKSAAKQVPLDPVLERVRQRLHAGIDLTSNLRNGQLRTLPGATLQADGFFAALFKASQD